MMNRRDAESFVEALRELIRAEIGMSVCPEHEAMERERGKILARAENDMVHLVMRLPSLEAK